MKLMSAIVGPVFLLGAPVSVQASAGWHDYYNCGHGLTATVSGHRQKIWLLVQSASHHTIVDEEFFADKATFHTRWQHRKVIVRYRLLDERLIFAGHACSVE